MIRTERLILRRWIDSDLDPFAAMNSDPEVMRYLPSPMTRQASEDMIGRMDTHLDEQGWGLWALDHEGSFLGFAGLANTRFDSHFTPAVEVGWRLARQAWGQGFATEAASAALRVGFLDVGLPEVVSLTVPSNERSWRVMERLGMTRDPADDFDHPFIEPGHVLRRHLLYRLSADRWRATI